MTWAPSNIRPVIPLHRKTSLNEIYLFRIFTALITMNENFYFWVDHPGDELVDGVNPFLSQYDDKYSKASSVWIIRYRYI